MLINIDGSINIGGRLVITISVPVVEVSYGVDLERLDALIQDNQRLASDLNLMRPTERRVETILRLRQRLLWRVRHYGGEVFTQRELEVMRIERRLMEPPFSPTLKEIAKRMQPPVTHQRVSVLMRNADELMYFFQIANDDFTGWVNTGNREHPNWMLQAPTERQTTKVLRLFERVAEVVKKVA